jgi:hypothetical protein
MAHSVEKRDWRRRIGTDPVIAWTRHDPNDPAFFSIRQLRKTGFTVLSRHPGAGPLEFAFDKKKSPSITGRHRDVGGSTVNPTMEHGRRGSGFVLAACDSRPASSAGGLLNAEKGHVDLGVNAEAWPLCARVSRPWQGGARSVSQPGACTVRCDGLLPGQPGSASARAVALARSGDARTLRAAGRDRCPRWVIARGHVQRA